ncbi:MAG: hypothetical protein ACQEP6_00285 [Patescibacteria group bacterium]
MKDLSSLKIIMNWKQALLYEAAIISLGIIIGSQWPEIFTGMVKVTLWVIFVTAGGYMILLWTEQNRDKQQNKDRSK